MTKPASERLLEHVKPFLTDSIGVSLEGIARIPLTAEVLNDIEKCLSSREVSELKWGLWFANGILSSSPPQEFLKSLLPRVPVWLRHDNWDVRDRALDIFVRLRENYKNYKDTMLTMLQDPEAVVRWHALNQYQTFLGEKDVAVLLKFQNDDYMAETSMGSPLVYAIRNDALAAIEVLSGQRFRKSENVKNVEGSLMVYWWDWQPFLDWWDRHERGWRFWKK